MVVLGEHWRLFVLKTLFTLGVHRRRTKVNILHRAELCNLPIAIKVKQPHPQLNGVRINKIPCFWRLTCICIQPVFQLLGLSLVCDFTILFSLRRLLVWTFASYQNWQQCIIFDGRLLLKLRLKLLDHIVVRHYFGIVSFKELQVGAIRLLWVHVFWRMKTTSVAGVFYVSSWLRKRLLLRIMAIVTILLF